LDIIEIAIAIHIKEIGTTSGIDEDGLATHTTKGPHRAVDAARQKLLRLLVERMRM